jgi:hypothetical protein
LDFSQLDGLDQDGNGPEDPITPEPQPPDPMPPLPLPGPDDPEPAPQPEPDDDDDDDDFDSGRAKPDKGPEPSGAPGSDDLLEPTPIPAPVQEDKSPPPQASRPASDVDVNSLFSDIMLEQKKECDAAATPPAVQPKPAAAQPKPAPAQDDPEKRLLRMACEKAQEAYERMEAKRKEGADVSLVENLLGKSRAAMTQKDYVAALNMSGEALRVIDGIVVLSDDLLEPTPVLASAAPSIPVAPEAQQVPAYQTNGTPEQFLDQTFAVSPSSKADMGIASDPVFKEDGPSKVFSLDPRDDVTSIYEAPRQDTSVYDSRGHNDEQQSIYSGQAPEIVNYGNIEGSNTYHGPVEAQPAYAQQPVLTALCYNCNGAIPIYSDQRPLIITCPACGIQVQLD